MKSGRPLCAVLAMVRRAVSMEGSYVILSGPASAICNRDGSETSRLVALESVMTGCESGTSVSSRMDKRRSSIVKTGSNSS